MEHSISIDASYSANDLIYSLPLGFSYSLEDGQTDSNRYSITPTLTYLMPSSASAVAAYGLAARIEDRDDNVTLDEDGTSLGLGFAYILFFEKISRARFSIDYTYTDYDSFVREYGTDSGSDENREDRVLTTSLDIQYHITPVIGIYTTYSFIHSMSNVDTYDYNRHILELGIALKY